MRPASASRSSVCLFVEAVHFERPLDDIAVPAERKRAVAAHDRDHLAIEFGRERAVGRNLGFERGLALVERREIEEREFDRALDLVGGVSGQEHRGRMGIDALDGGSAVGCRLGEQSKDLVLGVVTHTRSLPQA